MAFRIIFLPCQLLWRWISSPRKWKLWWVLCYIVSLWMKEVHPYNIACCGYSHYYKTIASKKYIFHYKMSHLQFLSQLYDCSWVLHYYLRTVCFPMFRYTHELMSLPVLMNMRSLLVGLRAFYVMNHTNYNETYIVLHSIDI